MKVLSFLRLKAMIAINLFFKFQQFKKILKTQNQEKQLLMISYMSLQNNILMNFKTLVYYCQMIN